jgi:hypothetical protein
MNADPRAGGEEPGVRSLPCPYGIRVGLVPTPVELTVG